MFRGLGADGLIEIMRVSINRAGGNAACRMCTIVQVVICGVRLIATTARYCGCNSNKSIQYRSFTSVNCWFPGPYERRRDTRMVMLTEESRREELRNFDVCCLSDCSSNHSVFEPVGMAVYRVTRNNLIRNL